MSSRKHDFPPNIEATAAHALVGMCFRVLQTMVAAGFAYYGPTEPAMMLAVKYTKRVPADLAAADFVIRLPVDPIDLRH